MSHRLRRRLSNHGMAGGAMGEPVRAGPAVNGSPHQYGFATLARCQRGLGEFCNTTTLHVPLLQKQSFKRRLAGELVRL
jgi:hypothetical protein